MTHLHELLQRARKLLPDMFGTFVEAKRRDGTVVIEFYLKPMDATVTFTNGKTSDHDRAIIMYTVLKECDRLGMEVAELRLRTRDPGHSRWFADIDGGVAWEADPAAAVLRAFVSLLEQEVAA
jgi:hypothetical protein